MPILSPTWFVRVLVLAAAYFVSGRLGLLLAIPPGYATTVWLPSGIALAGVLLFGRSVWPGVLLGSFLVNGVSLVAFLIGLGAAAQAVVGGELVKRFAGTSLDSTHAIIRFLFWGGPVGCLVNATASVFVLVALGIASPSDSAINWVTWWVGDTVGVFVFAPLALFLGVGLKSRIAGTKILALVVPFAVTFSLSTSMFIFTSRLERAADAVEFDRRATHITREIEASLRIESMKKGGGSSQLRFDKILATFSEREKHGVVMSLSRAEAKACEAMRTVALEDGTARELCFERTREFESRSWESWFVLILGMTFTGVLEAFLLALFGQSNRVEKLVALRTRELEESHLRLLAGAKMSSLGQMAAAIGHEINNPLTIIAGHAEELLIQCDDGRVTGDSIRPAIDKIESTAYRISKIIHGLRSLARDSTKDLPSPIGVEGLISDALELCQARFRNFEIDLRVGKVPTGLLLTCRGSQVVEVLLNLLNNAFDAVLGQKERWVALDVSEEARFITFSVTDSGSGIGPEMYEKIMTPFFTTKEPGKGTGLGLSISRSLVQQHGGELVLDKTHAHTRFIARFLRGRDAIAKAA